MFIWLGNKQFWLADDSKLELIQINPDSDLEFSELLSDYDYPEPIKEESHHESTHCTH